MTTPEEWESLLDNPPAEGVRDLYRWSTNFDPGKGPFTLFLDLIGYSEDEYGETMYGPVSGANNGYVELGHLGDALVEYANNPTAVRAYVAALMAAEAGDDGG